MINMTKMPHHACFPIYLLSLYSYRYLFGHTFIICLSLVSDRISIRVLEYLCVPFFVMVVVVSFQYLCVCVLLYNFSLILAAFCPQISYQLVITIAYLNHSYLLVKSLVNFEFSFRLVCEYVCLYSLDACAPPHNSGSAGDKYILWPITFSYGWFHLKVWVVQ